MVALLVAATAVLALRLWAGPAPARPRAADSEPAVDLASSEPPDLWTPDALARLGTPDTVADLVAQGRADELYGLGYRGDVSPQD